VESSERKFLFFPPLFIYILANIDFLRQYSPTGRRFTPYPMDEGYFLGLSTFSLANSYSTTFLDQLEFDCGVDAGHV